MLRAAASTQLACPSRTRRHWPSTVSPQPERAVGAAGQGETAIGAEAHRGYPLRMSGPTCAGKPTGHIPQSESAVGAARKGGATVAAGAHRRKPSRYVRQAAHQPAAVAQALLRRLARGADLLQLGSGVRHALQRLDEPRANRPVPGACAPADTEAAIRPDARQPDIAELLQQRFRAESAQTPARQAEIVRRFGMLRADRQRFLPELLGLVVLVQIAQRQRRDC